jgi:NADPH-dependent F420 reductase
MKIAIIGSGTVGRALAGASVRAGHSVTISARNPDHASAAAEVTGAKAAKSNADAVRGADVVILAVRADSVDQLIHALRPDLNGKVLVDTTNRVNLQDPGSVLDGTSMSERIQESAPGAHVVKAFNYSFAERMADPVVDGIRLDGFVAGDDQVAKAKALDLVESIGFRPIDAGPLVMARALEAMALQLILLQSLHKWPRQNGWKLAGPPAG